MAPSFRRVTTDPPGMHGVATVRGPDDSLVRRVGVPYREGEGAVIDAVEAADKSAFRRLQNVSLVLLDRERGSQQ